VLLDFQPLDLTKEIIVVDGGSTDHSVEIARTVQGVRVFESTHRAGRGCALRLGIEMARGSIIAFFPADREYKPEELYALTAPLVKSKYRVVFGTRAIKVRDLSEQLKGVYADNRGLYLTSKYGGMLLSILTLVFYNRYISDVLTSVKVFDARLLRRLNLKCDGRNLDAEICAKLGRLREYVLEYPVDYTPRNRREGKTITIVDGLRMMAALVRYRFGRRMQVVPDELHTAAPLAEATSSNAASARN
jgi:glycosyltransferase involved in cell wall biosynthesis